MAQAFHNLPKHVSQADIAKFLAARKAAGPPKPPAPEKAPKRTHGLKARFCANADCGQREYVKDPTDPKDPDMCGTCRGTAFQDTRP